MVVNDGVKGLVIKGKAPGLLQGADAQVPLLLKMLGDKERPDDTGAVDKHLLFVPGAVEIKGGDGA